MLPWGLKTIISLLSMGVFASEMYISYRNRAPDTARKADQGSLRLIWRVIPLAFVAAYTIAYYTHWGSYSWGRYRLNYAALLLVPAGMWLRRSAITALNEFFTVQVAIASHHRLIDTGLYRYIRHPSYTGIMLYVTGLALALSNWISALLILLPVYAVIRHRIKIEEAALIAHFGEQYQRYRQTTGGLLPKWW